MNARLRNSAGLGAAARSFVLTNWVTVSGSSTVTSVTQDAEEWLELPDFADAVFYVDIAQVVNPSGGLVLLYFETAPTRDESLFATVAGPIVGAPATTPYVAKTASAGAIPLCRFVRWRAAATAAGNWSVTFRVRVVGNRCTYFAPTQLSGCSLWLRADLGLTLNATTVSGWADQSGNGNNASQGTAGNQPGFVANGINGLPVLSGNGSSQYMITNAFTAQSSATLLAVVQSAVSAQAGYVRILEQQYNTTYYLGVNSTGAKYKLIVDNPTGPYGAAEGGTVATGANVIVSATYASPTGILYVNGSQVASDSFTAPTPASQPMYVMNCYNGFAEYWSGYLAEAIVYNRALNATELTRIHRYLGRRYGITVP